MNSRTLDQHIETSPDIKGGKPRIAGHRIAGRRHQAQDIAVLHERLGKAGDEIAAEFDLTLGDVYAALADYFDHRAEIDRSIDEDADLVRQLQSRTPSKVNRKLHGPEPRRASPGLAGQEKRPPGSPPTAVW